MKEYIDFAYVYDKLTENVNYSHLADYIEKIFKKYLDNKPELILDLACGTGSMANILSDRGYDMIGVDSSYDMLNVAMEKRGDRNILYLNQDAGEFELYGTVDAIVCLQDSINYITDEDSIDGLFWGADNYLNPGGLFIFDANTLYKFENVLSNNTLTYDDDKIFYSWENEYIPEDSLHNMYLTFFVKEDDVYHRFDEHHVQRYYSEEFLDRYIHKYGFEKLGVFAERTFEKPHKSSERIFYILRKNV